MSEKNSATAAIYGTAKNTRNESPVMLYINIPKIQDIKRKNKMKNIFRPIPFFFSSRAPKAISIMPKKIERVNNALKLKKFVIIPVFIYSEEKKKISARKIASKAYCKIFLKKILINEY